jgi:hypothetical protein
MRCRVREVDDSSVVEGVEGVRDGVVWD